MNPRKQQIRQDGLKTKPNNNKLKALIKNLTPNHGVAGMLSHDAYKLQKSILFALIDLL